MGKTPGKWIKNLLLGKKSSKLSNLSKAREVFSNLHIGVFGSIRSSIDWHLVEKRFQLLRLNSATKGEAVVSSKYSVSELTVSAPVISPPLVSQPLVGTGARNEEDSEIRVAADVPNDVDIISSEKEDGSKQAVISSASQEDLEIIKQEEAATKAQSAYRGYVARRAYRTLKGIIRLQALIRGHLVRRQAVSSLFCVQGIVKLQALIRGQLARHSDIGVEVSKTQPGAKCFDFSGASASSQVERLSKIVFVQKLLASLPTAIPLHLQYGLEEPNSAWVWLERWTRSCFWEPVLQPKKSIDSRSRRKHPKGQTTEIEKAKPKGSARRLSGSNVENGSNRFTSDSEKTKRSLRKVSSHTNSVQEHQQNEVEKVKSNKRKSFEPKKVSDRSMVGDERPKDSTVKSLASAAPNDPEEGTSEISEKMKHMEVVESIHSDVGGSVELPSADEPVEKLEDHHAADIQPMENHVKIEEVPAINQVPDSTDHFISTEDKKTSQRRASFPVKFDHQENGVHNTHLPRVPSYMAPTASAKARLRGQGSPRFDRDIVEKNVITRRHSLSASTNTKLSSLSPRAQGLVQAAGKGAIRSDKSLSSSRDGFDKVVQPEWRR